MYMGAQTSDTVTHKGLTFKKLYDEQKCSDIIQKLADEINAFYSKIQEQTNDGNPVQLIAICLLKGAFMFYTDLCKKLKHKIQCQFIKVSSYKGEHSTGQVKIEGGFNPERFKGKHVLIIEDMADTGLTLSKFREVMQSAEPKTMKIAVLVNRPDKPKNFTIDWVGLHCSDFIIGYGLDYDQFGRTFPAIYQKV